MIAILMTLILNKDVTACGAAKRACEGQCETASHEVSCEDACDVGYTECMKVPYRSQCKTFQNQCMNECQYDDCEDACSYGAKACWLQQE